MNGGPEPCMKVGVEEGVPKYAPFPHPALSLYLTTLGFMAGRLVLVIPGRRPGKQTAKVAGQPYAKAMGHGKATAATITYSHQFWVYISGNTAIRHTTGQTAPRPNNIPQ
jgi:hypothetical protein